MISLLLFMLLDCICFFLYNEEIVERCHPTLPVPHLLVPDWLLEFRFGSVCINEITNTANYGCSS